MYPYYRYAIETVLRSCVVTIIPMVCKDSGIPIDVRDVQIIMCSEARAILGFIIGALAVDLNLNANE